MLRGMSYKLRIPLSLVATALFTTLVVGLVMAWHTYRNVHVELIDHGSRLSHALASAVRPALLHDDLWLAYGILRGPRSAVDALDMTLIVLDDENRIFASNRPRNFPVAMPLSKMDAPLAGALNRDQAMPLDGPLADMDTLADRLLLAAPITAEGVSIGSLLLVYPRQVMWPRFASIVEQGGFSILLVLAVIVPIGWYWGRRMVGPLLRLATCMTRVREEDLEQIDCSLEEGSDEIGCLNTRFRELLIGLRDKRELERQMISSGRLAAVGRLAAGVAHEINNPLGGMLVAIDTLRRRGVSVVHTERTLSLLERGLTQIQDTVSALLVEARRESHPLTAQDIEDTRTLVSTLADKRKIALAWDNRLADALPLPSTLVRQVVINVLLNAVQSTPNGGRIQAEFLPDPVLLSISIRNEGGAMEQDTLDHLFEPYYSNHKGGSGLGLWVTYQIVRQLRGELKVVSEPNNTRFQVTFPLPEREDRRDAA